MARLLLAVVLVVAACTAGANPAEHFCEDYGNAVRDLYAAADGYATAPAEFAAQAKSTKDTLTRLRPPTDDLRTAFDSARFSLMVFTDDAALADFLARNDFAHDTVVLTCAENGVDLTPS